MKLKFLQRSHTDGVISIETAVCSASIILLFAVFFTITGYCRAYMIVKEYAMEKTMDTALLGYALGFDIPGIMTGTGIPEVKNGKIKNLIIYSESWGVDTLLNTSYTYVSLLGTFRVKFKSRFTGWEGDKPDNGQSVWSLAPAQRGHLIESIFGGGLPEFFPVIDAYDEISGHAASIVSIDTTLERYKSGIELKNIILKKAVELISFSYGEYEDVVISGMDIDSRELIVVIPENPLNESQQNVLSECFDYMSGESIIITIKRYQQAQSEPSVQPLSPWEDIEQNSHIWYN